MKLNKSSILIILVTLSMVGIVFQSRKALRWLWLGATKVPRVRCSVEEQNLIALGQRTLVEGGGTFLLFIGTAHIDNKDWFYYYSGSEKEGYSLNKVDNEYNDVRIFEDVNEANARVVINKCRPRRKYEFHIPGGSIVRDFSLEI